MLIFLAIPEDAVLQDVKMTSTPTYIPPTETIVGFTAVLLGLGDSGFNTQIMGILGLLYKVGTKTTLKPNSIITQSKPFSRMSQHQLSPCINSLKVSLLPLVSFMLQGCFQDISKNLILLKISLSHSTKISTMKTLKSSCSNMAASNSNDFHTTWNCLLLTC